jgi:uncharacterized membrane protein YozB (DUF420 family)
MGVSVLPTVNAVLNATAAVLLACGYAMIRRRRIPAHRACMLGAFAASVLFLASHILLAAAILPMAIVTLSRALRARYARHRQIARWTLPVWMYVSVTGVVIYVMLYRIAW